MLTVDQVEDICRRLSLELTGEEDGGLSEEVSCIVYRTDVFDCEDTSVTGRHIDIEYDFGDYYEIEEDSPLFQHIVSLCGLPPGQAEQEMVIYQAQ